MTDRWRQHLRQTGEPWYLLAEAQGEAPRLIERGGVTRFGVYIANLVVGYGSEPGPWVKVGTWDAGYSGTDPGSDVRAADARDGIADRLVGTATASGAEPAALAPWESAELRIDGQAHPAWRSGVGAHQVIYTTAAGRCVFVHSHGAPIPMEIVSCADQDLLDAMSA
jgi:hypothetical protein